ncbi:MAG: glycerol kinase GlpK [Candidatus Borkfalkiaceae bacterium]|nr:glycerol kinase GlpK [Clostridia bacterium]MDY6222580.1 glycerol kinase GlpK [Christensenellaceae bacterium]
MKYVLALDQGTTSSRAALVSEEGKIVCILNREFPQIYPKEGWVEHDPTEIWSSQYGIMMEAIAKSGVSAEDIAAIGITNQRETTVVWEKSTGKPVYNAIVWQCRRTAGRIEEIVKSGAGDMIREKTGLIADAYFSASKIEWILNEVDPDRVRAKNGELLFGTVDSYLIWKLTGGKVHATDRTNAARTMLFNIHAMQWDEELLRLFNIPRAMLPKVLCSGDDFGFAPVGGREIPVFGVAGDQQAALFGQCCFSAGEAKNTYGTGCFLLMNTGETPAKSKNGLLTTAAATLSGEKPQYALEGSVFIGGAVIQWLRDEMRFFAESKDAEYYARKVEDTGGVYLVPAFTGIGAPYWDMYARGIIVGLTRGTRREHIVRAAQESIAFQSAELVFAMEKDTGIGLKTLKADGGASRDGFLMQFQSDIVNKTVVRPVIRETTALGAAYLAGLRAGVWQDRNQLKKLWLAEKEFTPAMGEAEREKRLCKWRDAVNRCRGWAKES